MCSKRLSSIWHHCCTPTNCIYNKSCRCNFLNHKPRLRSLQVSLSGLCLERCPLTSASSVSSLQRPLLRTASLPPSPPLSPATSSSALFPPSLLSVNLHGGSSRQDKSSRRALRENRPQRAKIADALRNSARQRKHDH